MKIFKLILLGSLLLIAAAPTFAAKGTSGEVRVSASIIDQNGLKFIPHEEMKMPTMYSSDTAEEVSSSDTSRVAGGDGHDAYFVVAGPPNFWYSVNFNERGLLFDSLGHQLIIYYGAVNEDDSTSGSGACMQLSEGGSADLYIRGFMDLDGKQASGSYNNYTNPTIFTVVVDSGCEEEE